MFEQRQPARPQEIAQLIVSFDAFGLPELELADVSEIATLAELQHARRSRGEHNPPTGVVLPRPLA